MSSTPQSIEAAAKPCVMVMHPHLEPVAALLEADYTVLRAWTQTWTLANDGAGPSRAGSDAVRAVVVAGDAPLDTSVLERLPSLKLIACFTTGYDGIDIAWARSRGLIVTHAPGANTKDVVDHALGMIIACRRRFQFGEATLRSGGWTPERRFITPSLTGQRVGIVGLGRIGLGVMAFCDQLGMTTSWWGPRPKADASRPRAESVLEMARASDVLVVCCPSDATNRRLISAEIIQAIGPDGLLVNVARGALVDEDALIAALKDGRLGGAALDVFETEPTPPERWADVPNTLLTPHMAGATRLGVANMVSMLRANLDSFFAGAVPPFLAPEFGTVSL
jgi:lactate dehydrogenase-like 2-hydroxyacid dehydrogenase